MDVKGSQQFNISKEQLWLLLMNPDTLAEITPGVSDLEQVEEDQYRAVTKIKIGPVKAQFSGKLGVHNKKEAESFEITMEQESKIGNAQVSVLMELDEIDKDTTVLKFDGKANLSGLLARTGQRVLSGVANSITKQVFANMEEIIEQKRKNI